MEYLKKARMLSESVDLKENEKYARTQDSMEVVFHVVSRGYEATK